MLNCFFIVLLNNLLFMNYSFAYPGGGGGMYSRMGGFSRSFGGSSGGGNRNFARWYGR